MGELQIGQLGTAGARVQQQHDAGGVAAGLKSPASAGGPGDADRPQGRLGRAARG